jgi:hypothetical protein
MLALRFAAVVVMAALTDVVWVHYIQNVTAKRAAAAGIYNVGIVLCSAFVVVSYIEHRILLLAYALGAFLGTFVAVKRSKS